MKPIYRLIFLTFFLLLIPFSASAEFNKTKIAVLDFQLQGEKFDNADMGTIVAEWFITAMVREGRFDVVERRMLEKVLGEQQLAMSGVVDANSATRIGKLLGVKVIITGSVMKLKDITEINARIIDVESASIIAAENVRSLALAPLQDLVIEMSRKIIKNFPLEGYIVNRSGESVTLDLGNRTGVKNGMRFIVYKEGQVIKHPKTGEVLDVERIQTGTITITNVMKNICNASIDEETSPGSVNYGQQVKSLIDTSPKDARLVVDTLPANARVRILNITPTYEPGIVLEPGPYHIEVSAPGYATFTDWISLAAKEQKTISVRLESSAPQAVPQTYQAQQTVRKPAAPPVVSQQRVASQPQPPRSLSGEQKKFIRMLESSSIREKRDAAKLITRKSLTDTVILDVVERELLAGYRTNGSDRNHVDTMAWFCKALGASRLSKYRATLSQVANNGPNRKLRGYAEKSLRLL